MIYRFTAKKFIPERDFAPFTLPSRSNYNNGTIDRYLTVPNRYINRYFTKVWSVTVKKNVFESR